MVARALVAGLCVLAVTCGGNASSASSRSVERTSLPAVEAGGAPSTWLASRELPGLPSHGVPRVAAASGAARRPGWGGVIAAGAVLVVVVVAVITAAKRRRL